MAKGGIARVSQIQLLQPFVTFVLAALFNGETITPQIVLFASAVVATVAISTRTRTTGTVIPEQRAALNPESRDSPMCNCTSEFALTRAPE
jgi:drug/metabolite transporter (DMT)-like permease